MDGEKVFTFEDLADMRAKRDARMDALRMRLRAEARAQTELYEALRAEIDLDPNGRACLAAGIAKGRAQQASAILDDLMRV